MNQIIRIDTLYRDLMVHFGSKKTLRKELRKYVSEKAISQAFEKCNFEGKGQMYINQHLGIFFIWMPNKPESAEDVGFLIHEISHAVISIMQTIGVNLSDDSEEIYAYTIGFLTHQIIERFGIIVNLSASQ